MLEEKILDEFRKAMKDKDVLRVSTLSFLRAELKNVAIDKKKDRLEDADVISVIKKQVKQHEDSIEQFKKGARLDLVQKESGELEILKSFLPEQLSEERIKEAIEEVIALTGANKPQDMGKVMKELLPKLSGKADNKLVSELVRQRLTQKTDVHS